MGKEKMLPGNFAPPPCPPTLGHFTSSWQGPSLSPSTQVALPHPGKGCKVLGSAWQLSRTNEEKGPRKGAAVSFGFEEGAYELDLTCTGPRPRYPTFQIRSCHCCPLSVTPGRGSVQDVRHCAKRDLVGVREGRGAHRAYCL